VGDISHLDEDPESTSHPAANNLDDDEDQDTPAETALAARLAPSPPPIILKPDPELEEEHDSFPQDLMTYQTPISSPMSSPFLTPRSTRGKNDTFPQDLMTYQTPISSPMSSPFLTPRSTRGKNPYADSTVTLPLLPVDTTKPTLITVTQSEPLAEEYIPTLESLPIYIRGPPVARPGTSYSWLGRMFDPIDPEIEAAQKEGWVNPVPVENVEEAEGEGKGRKGRRLRRKFFGKGLETLGEDEDLERKGSAEEKGGRKVWDYVKKIVKG